MDMQTNDEAGEILEALKEIWVTDTDISALRDMDMQLLRLVQSEVTAHHKRVDASERNIYETIAKVTRFLPNFVLSRMGPQLSPYSTARVATLLDAKHAASLSKNFEPEYLAEVALHLEAKRAGEIAAHTDLDTLHVINEALLKKGLYRRLGELSDHLDDRVLSKLAKRMRNPEGIAAIALHMQVVAKVAAVSGSLDREIEAAVRVLLERHGAGALVAAIDDING
jgi:hypothetical protein